MTVRAGAWHATTASPTAPTLTAPQAAECSRSLRRRRPPGLPISAPSSSEGIGEGDWLAGRLGVGDFSPCRLPDVPTGVDDQDSVGQVDLAQVESVQNGLLLGGGRLVRLARAATMTPVNVRSRFTARISVMNLADPQMQTISGRLVTTRPYRRPLME